MSSNSSRFHEGHGGPELAVPNRPVTDSLGRNPKFPKHKVFANGFGAYLQKAIIGEVGRGFQL